MATTFAKIALAGGLFLGVLAFAENRASAMPLADQSVAAVTTPAQAIEKNPLGVRSLSMLVASRLGLAPLGLVPSLALA
jgi:hypothetical protein